MARFSFSGHVPVGSEPFVVKAEWSRTLRSVLLVTLVMVVTFGSMFAVLFDSAWAGVGVGLLAFVPFGGILCILYVMEIRGARDGVLLVVDEQGIYLSSPPRLIPWSRIAEVALFERLRSWTDEPEWTPQLAVRRRGAGDGRRPPPDESSDPLHHDWQPKELLADLPHGAVSYRDLRSAVARHAADVLVKDYGRVGDGRGPSGR